MFFMAPVNERWEEREAKARVVVGSTRQAIVIGFAVVCVGLVTAVLVSLMAVLIDLIGSQRQALLTSTRDAHGVLAAWLANTAAMCALAAIEPM